MPDLMIAVLITAIGMGVLFGFSISVYLAWRRGHDLRQYRAQENLLRSQEPAMNRFLEHLLKTEMQTIALEKSADAILTHLLPLVQESANARAMTHAMSNKLSGVTGRLQRAINEGMRPKLFRLMGAHAQLEVAREQLGAYIQGNSVNDVEALHQQLYEAIDEALREVHATLDEIDVTWKRLNEDGHA